MKKMAALILATMLIGAGISIADEKGADPANGKAKELFEAKCAICHPLSRPLGETMNRDGWMATVTRMKKVNGCPITDEEAKVIVDYLVKVRGPAARTGKK
jgi:cytochrome c